MSVVRKYLSIEELTHTLLREMVEKIVVYECEYDENEVRRQRIDIYYSFVARLTCPKNKARPIRHPAQVPDRNGKIFYNLLLLLYHTISKSIMD